MKIQKKLLRGMLKAVLIAILFLQFGIVYAQISNPEYSKQIGYEGSVLLENRNNALPLAQGTKVAVFGINQIDYIRGGGGSGDVRVAYSRNLVYGLQQKVDAGKIQMYNNLATFYQNAYASGSRNTNEPTITAQMMTNAKTFADVAIISIGRYSAEAFDRKSSKGDYLLSDSETTLISQVLAAGFSKVIVVLNIGSTMDTSWFKDQAGIDAVLLVWQPGMEGGNLIADMLVGDAYPSGKLADTFVKSYADYPTAVSFNESDAYQNYEEDIYLGYRYFETLAPTKVNYEFGYGLGYTTFLINGVSVQQSGDNLVAKATVKNTGTRAGKEVVQVYYSAPQGKLGKPAKILASFLKTKELAPGESQDLTLTFPVNTMASYDDVGHVAEAAYVLEAGDYSFFIGSSVRNCTEATYRYHLDNFVVTEQLTHQLVPEKLEKRLLANGTYETLRVEETPTHYNIPETGSVKIEMEGCQRKQDELHFEQFLYPNYSRGVCVSYFNESGRWVEYDLNVETAGNYRITLNAANAFGQAANNAYTVSIDGTVQSGINIVVPNTGDRDKSEWFNFELIAPFTVYLPEGNSRLRFTNNGGEVGNLDFMIVESASSVSQSASSKIDNRTVSNYQFKNTFDGKRILLQDVAKDHSLMPQFLAQLTDEELCSLSGGHPAVGRYTKTESMGCLYELGIPAVKTTDGPAGVNLYTETTHWPGAVALACTWNVDIAKEFGSRVADECVEYGLDIWLAPGMNIHRDPLCGRNFEYYSEDPYLTGKIAAAVTKGVQADTKNISITLKHFIANNKESNRRWCDSRISERALREIYLKGFEIAVKEAAPWAIMSSYNPVNGVKTSESGELLINILRNEWGFDGLVMTDWDNEGQHTLEAKAGNDIKMPLGYPNELKSALESGFLTRAELERNVENILNLILKTNSFASYDPEISMTVIIEEDTRFIPAEKILKSSGAMKPEECKDSNNLDVYQNLAYCEAGEWTEYEVNVKEAGTYKIYPRIASSEGKGKFNLQIDDEIVASFASGGSTGGWQNWATRTNQAKEIELKAGKQKLRINITEGGLNINLIYFKFQKGAGIDVTDVDDSINVYPNPAKAGQELFIDLGTSFDTVSSLELFNIDGRYITSVRVTEPNMSLIMPETTGLYLLKVKSGASTSVYKITVI